MLESGKLHQRSLESFKEIMATINGKVKRTEICLDKAKRLLNEAEKLVKSY